MSWKKNIYICQKLKIIKYKICFQWQQILAYVLCNLLIAITILSLKEKLQNYYFDLCGILKHMLGFMSMFLILPMLQEKYDLEWGVFYRGLKYNAYFEIIFMIAVHIILICFQIFLISNYILLSGRDIVFAYLYNIGYILFGISIMNITGNIFAGYAIPFIIMLVQLIV